MADKESDKQIIDRRTALKTIGGTSVALSVGTGVAAASGNGNGKGGNGGGAGFTFTKPSVDTFTIVKETDAQEETFQRGCGNGGKLQPYDFFYAVDSFDGDGETDRLYPHPSDKRPGTVGDSFKINNVCETETGRDRPAYWVKFSPA